MAQETLLDICCSKAVLPRICRARNFCRDTGPCVSPGGDETRPAVHSPRTKFNSVSGIFRIHARVETSLNCWIEIRDGRETSVGHFRMVKANQALQLDDQRWRAAFENSGIGIAMADFAAFFFAANRAILNRHFEIEKRYRR